MSRRWNQPNIMLSWAQCTLRRNHIPHVWYGRREGKYFNCQGRRG